MKLILTFLFTVVSFAAIEAREIPTDISQKNKPATVKVLIGKEKEAAHLEIKGRYQLYHPTTGILMDTGILSKRGPIQVTQEGLQWLNQLNPGTTQIRIVPGDSQCALLIDGVHYRGCIEIYASEGKLNIINEVDVENYLKATLSPLFPNEKNRELLDALAITARTHLYYILSRNSQAFWHLEATEAGYEGAALAHQNMQLDRSIDTTRYMVMTYQQAPFAALWTQDSAGKTAPFSAIFRKETQTPQGVSSPIAQNERLRHTWNLTVTKEQLAQITNAKSVSGVDLFLDQTSGKVYALRVHDGMNSKDINFFALQKALGIHKLRSNDFTISIKKENILFSGYGEGHGVGLCLYSARFMADHGEKATKILSTFFPQTQLEHLRSVSN